MATLAADTTFQKQNGTLSLHDSKRALDWAPSGAPKATFHIDVSAIARLQATPPTNPKIMHKIFVTEPGRTDPVAHTFQYNDRQQADVMKDRLSLLMAAIAKAAETSSPGKSQSAAMAMAAAVSGGKNNPIWEDDDRLVADVRLQNGLMKQNDELQRTFLEAKNMKPESLSLTQFTKQFWTSRVHLLRAFALSQAQNRGNFNVFADIQQSRTATELNLSGEQIKKIFEQYPIMRIVYDDVVPAKIRQESEFWSRFFQSQLHSTLRGMKVDHRVDAKDAILDTFLDHPLLTGKHATSSELHIPKFIDLEGNEENHSQRKGNAPNREDRSRDDRDVPVIRRLNALSEKLMAAVRQSDVNASDPIGLDEHEFNQLRLRDLENEEARRDVALSIRDQSSFFNNKSNTSEDLEVKAIRKVEADKAIRDVLEDLNELIDPEKASKRPELDNYLDMLDLDDEDLENQLSGNGDAGKHIDHLVEQNQLQSSDVVTDSRQPNFGLSAATYDRLIITHHTTKEFLSQFYNAFYSGEASRIGEIESLIESLNASVDRINALAADAEGERKVVIKKADEQAKAYFASTGKKKRVNYEAIQGGEAVVKQLLSPELRSLGVAVTKYKQAVKEQSAEAG